MNLVISSRNNSAKKSISLYSQRIGHENSSSDIVEANSRFINSRKSSRPNMEYIPRVEAPDQLELKSPNPDEPELEKMSKKEKLNARFTSKRSSMPDNSINNRLANELNMPLNLKQISMTPDVSRNVSPVCSSKKVRGHPHIALTQELSDKEKVDIRNSNSKLILNNLAEQSRSEDEFDFS
jgi:hypothetical protein